MYLSDTSIDNIFWDYYFYNKLINNDNFHIFIIYYNEVHMYLKNKGIFCDKGSRFRVFLQS